jgi:hypothetical protein
MFEVTQLIEMAMLWNQRQYRLGLFWVDVISSRIIFLQ